MTSPITLYHFGPHFGLPDPSPFCLKAEMQLKMSGLAYRTAVGQPAEAPKGKLPWIRDGERAVADSTFIRDHLERTAGIDLDAGLDARGRAESWAFERLIEDHLYWAMVQARWLIPENFARGPRRFFERAPADRRDALAEAARERVAAALHGQGLGRHAPDEIAALGARSLAALAARLGGAPFFGGAAPIALDATAFGMLAAILVPDLPSPLRDAAAGHATLRGFVDRMLARFWG